MLASPTHSTRPLTLLELLTLARPAVGEGWHTPFAWFVHCQVGAPFPACEALTTESVEALASYLGRRYRELGGTGTLLELHAGR